VFSFTNDNDPFSSLIGSGIGFGNLASMTYSCLSFLLFFKSHDNGLARDHNYNLETLPLTLANLNSYGHFSESEIIMSDKGVVCEGDFANDYLQQFSSRIYATWQRWSTGNHQQIKQAHKLSTYKTRLKQHLASLVLAQTNTTSLVNHNNQHSPQNNEHFVNMLQQQRQQLQPLTNQASAYNNPGDDDPHDNNLNNTMLEPNFTNRMGDDFPRGVNSLCGG
ncbi:MAG: hypothetical protein AAF153_03520, partial [Pseudomonadota bacterium]